MPPENKNCWDRVGVDYTITIAISTILIIVLANLFHIEDPTWALVSAVVCTELDLSQTRRVVSARIGATLVGAIGAFVVLSILGPGYIAIITGTMLISLICHYLIRIGTGWKLATATGVIVLIGSLQQHSVALAENIAIKRALEVIVGSIVAGIVSILLGNLWKAIENRRKH